MKRVIALIMMAVFVTVSFSGCKVINSLTEYWDGMTKGEAQEYIQNTLQEKYGEEFEVKGMYLKGGTWNTSSDLLANCSPKSDEKIVFAIEVIAIGNERMIHDTYIQALVGNEMRSKIESVLSSNFKNFAAEVYVYGLADAYDSGIRSSNEASIENFTKALPENNWSVIWIAFDKNEILSDFNRINIYIKKIVEHFSLSNCHINCYFVTSDTVNQCKEKINTNHIEYDYKITDDMEVILSSQRPIYRYLYQGSESSLTLDRISNQDFYGGKL